jgi:hypothetical protein
VRDQRNCLCVQNPAGKIADKAGNLSRRAGLDLGAQWRGLRRDGRDGGRDSVHQRRTPLHLTRGRPSLPVHDSRRVIIRRKRQRPEDPPLSNTQVLTISQSSNKDLTKPLSFAPIPKSLRVNLVSSTGYGWPVALSFPDDSKFLLRAEPSTPVGNL